MTCDKQVASSDNSKRVGCKHYIPSADLLSCGVCGLQSEFICKLDLQGGNIPRLSHSSITDWMTCHRLYYLKHIQGISVKPSAMSNAVKMGALWDRAMGVLLGQNEPADLLATINEYEIDSKSVAKVRALYKAFKTLDININSFCKFQYEFTLPMEYKDSGNYFTVKGVMDRYYADDHYFAETKLSSKPDWYDKLFNIIPQCSTYFLADEALSHVVLEVTRVPDLRSTGANADEDDQTYEARCLKDILSRPAFYFIGYNKESRTFGRKYYRSEFPLEEVKNRLESVYFEILDAEHREDYYKNYRSCYSPFQCDYLNVCQYDTVSEEIYEIKLKPAGDDNEK